jgi:catechol 2,3-dioxygenase-like lactoylglutathione lyase family enzyme
MAVQRLDHFSIRTADLASTRQFYTDVLGFTVGPRPDFPFPGVWLYEGDIAVVHVIGIDPTDSSGLQDYLGDRDQSAPGTGMIDHVAFLCGDIDGMRARIAGQGLEFRERQVPALALRQIFVSDPSGVTIELNFPQ